MTAEILVNVTPRETRAAVVENGVLQEVYVERTNRRGITSNIYKGRVSRTLPGMQAAFIDIGLERTAFLHVSDIAQPEIDGDTAAALPRTENIRDLVNEGDDLPVQVLKALATKLRFNYLALQMAHYSTMQSKHSRHVMAQRYLRLSIELLNQDMIHAALPVIFLSAYAIS